MKITYWSDYACPYCYIGNTRLKRAISELGLEDEVEFEAHSFELDQNAPKDVESTTVERFGEKYGLTKEKAEEQVENISRLGIEEGIDFRYATTLYTNTRDAHRLVQFAKLEKSPEIAEKLDKLLYDAYFTQNLKLSDEDVLVGIAERSGLEREETLEVLRSDKFNQEVIYDERLALGYGIRAVPFYVFDEKYAIPGALSYEDFKKVLTQVKSNSEVDDDQETDNCEDGTCSI